MVEDLKHNIPSVGKMCDQGYNIIFNSQKCEIREVDLGRLVATTTKNPNNIYILDRVKRKRIEAPQKRTKDNNKEGELVLSTQKRRNIDRSCRKMKSYPFPLMSKGGRERKGA